MLTKIYFCRLKYIFGNIVSLFSRQGKKKKKKTHTQTKKKKNKNKKKKKNSKTKEKKITSIA